MTFDRDGLIDACKQHGRVARVVIAEVRGSTPRDAGTAMLVWRDGQSGTIGGGTLEHEATLAARETLINGEDRYTRHALGPDLGQCCGGHVTVLTEVYDLSRATDLPTDIIARGKGDMPLAVSRHLAAARNGASKDSTTGLIEGWMVEAVHQPKRPLWVWGAGHVGRAIVTVMHPLPDLEITWVDTAASRFPAQIPPGVTQLPATDPATLVAYAPRDADHLILTYSHALDLALCAALLHHDFGFAGLIGSATKWARFRKRLAEAGFAPERIARITCPIGNPELGKHPHQIALGVAAQLLHPASRPELAKERRA